MHNYFLVGTYPSSKKPYLAPDNFLGRFGATMWSKTDNGIGSWVIGSAGVIASSLITWGTLTGITLGGGAGIFWAVLSIFAVALTVFCILTAVSTVYTRLTRTRVVDIPGHRYDTARTVGRDIARVSETYRGMSREDRKTFKPIVKKMCSLSREGDFKGAYKRVEKFNEARIALDAILQKSQFVDNSDLDEMDALIKGIAEIRSARKQALDTARWK